jgi:hypothetical protein
MPPNSMAFSIHMSSDVLRHSVMCFYVLTSFITIVDCLFAFYLWVHPNDYKSLSDSVCILFA